MNELAGKIENLLFAAGDSVETAELAGWLGMPQVEIETFLDGEIARREAEGGLLIRRFEGRVQLATRPEYASLLYGAFGEATAEDLTRAMMETLAIVAYRQPVTRPEIEELRGVNTSYILNALVEKGLVKEAGRKEAVGRPKLYATSEDFLRHFDLSSLAELPPLPAEEEAAEDNGA